MFHSFEARTMLPRFTSPARVTICHVDSPSLSAAHLVKLCFHQLLRCPTHSAHLIPPQKETFQPLSFLTFACTFLVMSFPELCISFHRAWNNARETDLSHIFNNSLIKSAVKITHKLVLFLLKSKLNVNLFGENVTNTQDIPKRR